MKFNQHPKLVGCHAMFGASTYHWLNYDEVKLVDVYRNRKLVEEGTKTHEFAALCIERHQKLPKSAKTLNMYVNDAVGYRMKAEQVLYYSDNFFGTTDAISFDNRMLRIHDLKTGVNPASIHQLEIYAALFCLEYDVDPGTIDIELRIYQSNEVIVDIPDPETIRMIMQKIVKFDKILNDIKSEE